MAKTVEDKFVDMLKKRVRYTENPVTCSTCRSCKKKSEPDEEGYEYECHTLPDLAVFGVSEEGYCMRHGEKKKPRKKGAGRKRKEKSADGTESKKAEKKNKK